jgi:hypothetical protein
MSIAVNTESATFYPNFNKENTPFCGLPFNFIFRFIHSISFAVLFSDIIFLFFFPKREDVPGEISRVFTIETDVFPTYIVRPGKAPGGISGEYASGCELRKKLWYLKQFFIDIFSLKQNIRTIEITKQNDWVFV